jgi:ubiquinone/menaquinone biosynthesis C-methylase UbiE
MRKAMTRQTFSEAFDGTVPENYERFFVPAIGRPVAEDLVAAADLQPGESVLDVACGTGVIAKPALAAVAPSRGVVGLDVNPGMLAVAQKETPRDAGIEWREASAESMPLQDGAFDVVLCQMGLQFVPNKLGALREMRRVLAPGGRGLISVPGLTPPLFAIMADGLARDMGLEAASFVQVVFSLHDADELAGLLKSAGFRDIEVRTATKSLQVPAARDFLWQYINSTPLMPAIAKADDAKRAAFERDVSSRWQPFAANGGMTFEVGMTTAIARK